MGLMIAYAITIHSQIRKNMKADEERKRDYEALQKLNGEEYWKAYAEFKKKYQK